MFKNGKKIGRGQIYYANGSYFDGEFREDRPNGYGKIKYNNQDGISTY